MISPPGPTLFARFAYPPNSIGYCGTDDHRTLLEYASAGVVDPDLRALARGFEGAWPYLELIAAASAIEDPLDRRVVEAYWIGNELLSCVPMSLLATSLETRFRSAAGREWSRLAETLLFAPPVQHGFHVFAVYPWVGLLRGVDGGEPLRVLDRCRIRWGRVEALLGDRALVRARPLHWDGRHLTLAPAQLESVLVARDGYGLPGTVGVGDTVAMHWDWVCQRLARRQLACLRATTAMHLRLVNQQLATSPPRAVLS
jgi:Family of unknown function (DUF6390)